MEAACHFLSFFSLLVECVYLVFKCLLSVQIGDFGILVRSGFSVAKALFFNFLSALVALAGTAIVRTILYTQLTLPMNLNTQFNYQSSMTSVGTANGDGSRTLIFD